jgi:hypothetical protein
MSAYLKGGPTAFFVEIHDPVAGYHYVLDAANNVAHRSVLEPPAVHSMGSPTVYDPALPPRDSRTTGEIEYLTEELGSAVIHGVSLEGKLTRISHPAGMNGDDHLIVRTEERWYSRELELLILFKSSSPSSGELVRAWVNFSRAEQDPGLFEIPPGYEIVDETGPFTITIKRP